MPDSIQKALDHISNGDWQLPFMAMAGFKPKMNWARISELIIIAVISGLFANYITVQKLELKYELEIGYIKKDIADLKKDNQLKYDYLVGRIDRLGPDRITQ